MDRKATEHAASQTPQFSSPYGYWISPDGRIINVNETHGHLDVLYDLPDFAFMEASRPHDMHAWYEAALNRGWVRIVAPEQDRSVFRFQYRSLSASARSSLALLLQSVGERGAYIFESLDYRHFHRIQDAFDFIEIHNEVAEFATETWRTIVSRE
jgi:hypothetical protein